MRLIHHYVINKNTNEKVYTNCDQAKCIAFLNALDNKEDYVIGFKWLSI